MRAAAATAPRSFCRLFCTTKPIASSPTVPFASTPPSRTPPPALKTAEPNEVLFVTGLNKRTTSETLREAFKKFGEVKQARVVAHRVSGYSKGFGYVKYATSEDAAKGIKGMDGKFLEGWVVFAEYARPRTNAIASQTHTEPSHSKPEEKKKTPENNNEKEKETAGKKNNKNKKKKTSAKVVVDQPMDKDKDKK